MKAININGQIKEYSVLPKSWDNVIGGFNLLSDSELQNYGFYDIEIPTDYNSSIHNLGDIYWDESNNVFKKDISNKTWSQTLEELKENKINSFKLEVKNLLNDTDWYIIRNAETGASIPSSVSTERLNLRTQTDTVTSEINALTTKQEVIVYEFPII